MSELLVGKYKTIEIDGKLNINNRLEIIIDDSSNSYDYIDKEDAIKIIEHLMNVFEVTIDT